MNAQSQTDFSQKLSDEVDVLARTIFGEARGENLPGKEAVASVVINRVRRARKHGGHYWWGASVKAVCQKPWQFSCWNKGDANRAKITTVQKTNRDFKTCLRIARRAIAGEVKDRTGGATHYHNTSIDPLWSRGRMYAAQIGGHQFYNNVE